MAKSSIIVVALVAVLVSCCCNINIADSASVHNHHHLHSRLARSSSSSKAEDEIKFCSESTPCGWGVYTRFTRVIDYFMKNTCKCEPGLQCIRVDDDVSVSAYVYKCRTTSASSSDQGPTS